MGHRGFFYVSYEDTQIGRHNISYAGVESTENYSHIFQTDLCGWTGQLGYGKEEAWCANVYEAKEKGTVEAAGFYVMVPDTEYALYGAVVPGDMEPGEVFSARAGSPPWARPATAWEGCSDHPFLSARGGKSRKPVCRGAVDPVTGNGAAGGH